MRVSKKIANFTWNSTGKLWTDSSIPIIAASVLLCIFTKSYCWTYTTPFEAVLEAQNYSNATQKFIPRSQTTKFHAFSFKSVQFCWKKCKVCPGRGHPRPGMDFMPRLADAENAWNYHFFHCCCWIWFFCRFVFFSKCSIFSKLFFCIDVPFSV